MYDGSYKAFVCNLTRWVWKRIQAHRVRWMHSTPEGLALEEAAQRLKRTLDSSYAADDSRIYPLGKLRETLGCSAAIMDGARHTRRTNALWMKRRTSTACSTRSPPTRASMRASCAPGPADGAEEGR